MGLRLGEGMISLAHAFNYAGSKSILTGLWKIDEEVSMQFMDEFYRNLSVGLPKEEALRKAKLWYLKNNTGRALALQYWIGLVLMGDTTPLQVTQNDHLPITLDSRRYFAAIVSLALLEKKITGKKLNM